MTTRRTTVYLSPKVYRALKARSAASDRSLSELVNDAVRVALREDEIDRESVRLRKKEPSRAFSDVLESLARGRKRSYFRR